jgi:response regulator RpfG family c-di-GMP phosphodiesterase
VDKDNKQALLIDGEKVNSDLLTLNITTQIGLEVISTSSNQEAFGFLALLPDINIIIARYEEKGSSELLQYCSENNLQCKILIFAAKVQKISEGVEVLEGSTTLDQMIFKIKELINFSKQDLKSDRSGYKSINCNQFLYFTSSPVDVFVKVGTGDDAKYVKRFNHNGPVEKDFIEKFQAKGMKELFIRNGDIAEFTDQLTKMLLSKLNENKLLSNNNIQTEMTLHEVVFEKLVTLKKDCGEDLQKVGLHPEEIKLAHETITSVVNTFEKVTSMVDLLTTIFEQSSSLSYRHSYMTGIVGHGMLRELGQASKEYVEAYMFACLFHDIILESEPEIKIHTEAELKSAKLETKDLEKISKHALMAQTFVKQKGQYPPISDIIIRQHHGSETGAGFPSQISEKIHPLSLVFIVAEAFVIKVISNNQGKSINVIQILKEILAQYSGDQIPPMVEVLKRALLRTK